MKKPVLVIMAAGMGSRYGGLKQIDPIDSDGHIIIDFSIFDAKRAGFEEAIGNRMSKIMKVHYAYQEINDIPLGNIIPQGRQKPWGTAHAIYCCRDIIEGPFAVINADDYYGVEAFQLIYDYLLQHDDDTQYRYAMVGYQIEKTLTEHGTVARGVCEVNEQHKLINIVERTKIKKTVHGAAYSEDDYIWYDLPSQTTVSMNLWGFTKSIIKEINNGLQCEYFIPSAVSHLLDQKKATVEVLTTKDQWYGVTYKEDKPVIMKAIKDMKTSGIYPQKLWGE